MTLLNREVDTSYLDQVLFDSEKQLQAVPSDVLRNIDQNHLRVWCHLNGVYGLPTLELISFLQEQIAGGYSNAFQDLTKLDRKYALEIGAGCGAFGRALGIDSTDSFCQEIPEVKAYYEALKQPIVKYGKNVVKLEASEAIRILQPEVVFASWVTQHYDTAEKDGDGMPIGGGSVYGVREIDFMRDIRRYVIFGNQHIHHSKAVFSLPYVKVTVHTDPTCMFSRTGDHEQNKVWVVDNLKYGM